MQNGADGNDVLHVLLKVPVSRLSESLIRANFLWWSIQCRRRRRGGGRPVLGLTGFQHGLYDGLALVFPFGAIANGVLEILMIGHAKDSTPIQLACQRDDVKVEKAQFTFIPTRAGLITGDTLDPGAVTFFKEEVVEFRVHVPVLIFTKKKEHTRVAMS